MSRNFASEEIKVGTVKYDAKLVSPPVITESLPEFLCGIEAPTDTQFTVSDADKLVLSLPSLRNKRVSISDYYKSANETVLLQEGIVRNVDKSMRATFFVTPIDSSFLKAKFPTKKTNFPDAVDVDSVMNVVFGTARHVPLPLIKAFESVAGSQYQYFVAVGDVTVSNVYRAGQLISTFKGTAQGATRMRIQLDMSDNKNDDFYNDLFILITGGTGAGQVRRIVDYDALTKRAKVDVPWSVLPDSTSTYVIREWKKVLIDGNTIIEFAIHQRDGNGDQFTRDKMSADVIATERNPVNAIKYVLDAFGKSYDLASFNTAASRMSTFVDGAIVEERVVQDLINEWATIGNVRLRFNNNGEIEAIVNGFESDINGIFRADDNVVSVGAIKQNSLDRISRSVAVKYRRLFNSDEYRLTTGAHQVFDEGVEDEVFAFDFIDDKMTADKVADWIAKVRKYTDETIEVVLGHEARKRRAGDLIFFEDDKLNKSGIFQIIARSVSGASNSLTIFERKQDMFTHRVMALPDDPVTDSVADFRKTPAPAVSGLAVSWELRKYNWLARATLSWINPTTNFKNVVVDWKLSSSSVWNDSQVVAGEQTTIGGLEPGLLYDFRVTSVGLFGTFGGVASLLSQLAPGDNIAPATPTGLVGSGKLQSVEWTWDEHPAVNDDLNHFFYQFSSTASEAGLLESGQLPKNQNKFTRQAQTSALTSTVNRFFRLKAVDHTGNNSAYTSWVSASTTAVGQSDVANQAVHKIISVTNTATTTTNPLLTATFTNATNRPIWIEFSGFLKGSAGFILSIVVNGTTVYQDTPSGAFGPAPVTAKARVASPGTGQLTIEVFGGNIPAAGVSNRNLVVYEAKNA